PVTAPALSRGRRRASPVREPKRVRCRSTRRTTSLAYRGAPWPPWSDCRRGRRSVTWLAELVSWGARLLLRRRALTHPRRPSGWPSCTLRPISNSQGQTVQVHLSATRAQPNSIPPRDVDAFRVE